MAVAISSLRRRRLLRHQTCAEASHQPVMDGLAFRQHPDPERRIEIVHAFEDPLGKARSIEQQRMDAAAFRRSDHAFDVDFDLLGIEPDRESSRRKSAISRILKRGAQFANDLAQRGAGFFFVRTAPQQADETFAAFVFGLGQGEIAENGARLLGSKLDEPAVESDREPPHQRDGKARGSAGRCLGFPLGQHVNFGSLPHPKISAPGVAASPIYIRATPPV